MAKFRKGFYKGWLTDKALLELRKEISLNSIYVSDYENKFNISPKQVCDFFDGFNSYLEELISDDGAVPPYPKETGDSNVDWLAKRDWKNTYNEIYREYDNDTNLLAWYGCFADNPFTEFVEEEKFDSYNFAQIMAGCR